MSTACPTKTDGGDVGNPKAKIKPKAKSTPGTPSSKDEGTKNAPAARSLTTEPEQQPSPPTPPSTTENAGGEVKDALRDAAQALKSLMSSGSSTSSSSTPTLEGLQRQLDELPLKAMRMNKEGAELKKSQSTPLDARVLGELPVPPTLIDSGATHILRQPRDKAELSAASKVSVTLANDERRDLLQTESGAILSTSPNTQPILPMAELVSAGCEISWKRGVFKVVHPVWGELKTSLRGGCPELAQEQAAKLVNMIEEKKLKEFKDGVSLLKSKLGHLVQEERLPWTTYATRYVEGGSARDLWKAVHGSFMKDPCTMKGFSEATLDLLCPEVCVGDGWKTLKALELGKGPERLPGFEPAVGSSPMARRRVVGKSAPRVAALEGQREVYDDDLIVDLGETSDLEEEAEQLEVCLDVLSPRVACLGTSSRVGELEQRGGQDNEMSPEDYAKEILYEEEDVDEEVIKRLFELLPSQQFARESTETSEGETHPKAWASGAYRHGGVLGIRNSSKEFPYATRVVNQFIRTHLGEDATWSTFSIHRSLSVKRHRDSHNARDKYSRLIPITDFKEGGLWTQLGTNEEVNEDEVVMLDGKRGRVYPLRSEEGSMNVVSFDSRQWHATMPWKGERLVVAVYTVRGLERMSQDDADLALDLGFPLPQNAAVGDEPKMRKLLEGEGGNQTETDLELENSESIMYIRMSEEEWVTTSQTHGLNRYIAAMATRWRTIQPADEDLNSVIPAAIVADLERDWGQFPRYFWYQMTFRSFNLGHCWH